jgi:hypothetical protein
MRPPGQYTTGTIHRMQAARPGSTDPAVVLDFGNLTRAMQDSLVAAAPPHSTLNRQRFPSHSVSSTSSFRQG